MIMGRWMRAGKISALAAGLALLVACDNSAPPAAPPARPPAEVGVVTVAPEKLALFTDLPGRTAAFRVAEVRPQVTGIVLKRLFDEGSEVKAGQLLYEIDPASYQAALDSAKAELAKANATRKSQSAKAGRYKDLVGINAVSKQDFDDVSTALEQANAQIAAAKAALDAAQVNLDRTRILAPISGRAGKSLISEGALVTSGQATALVTITQLDPIYVDVTQSSADLLRLRREIAAGRLQAEPVQNAPVTLMLEGMSQPYGQPGQLQFSDVTVDATTGAVQLRAVFPNPGNELLPGLFVRARVEQAVRDNAIALPQPAVIRNPDGTAMVWVVGADNKVAPRPVTTGQALGNRWVILSGLQGGEQVVLEGVQKIRPGAEVKPVPATVKKP